MNMYMSSLITVTYLILEWVCHGIFLLDNGQCERNSDMTKKPNLQLQAFQLKEGVKARTIGRGRIGTRMHSILPVFTSGVIAS